jgi:hypothetical protein
MNIIKLSVLKNWLSDILSVGHPNISVVSGILSVVGIPPVPVPIPEEIQLSMYAPSIMYFIITYTSPRLILINTKKKFKIY